MTLKTAVKTMTVRATITAILAGISASAYAFADSPKPINIRAGDLITALDSLVKQSGAELVYRGEQLKGLHTSGVSGTLSAEQAVTQLIAGTALIVKTDPSGAILIALPRSAPTSDSAVSSPSASDKNAAQSSSSSSPPSTDARGDQKRSFWDRFRLAQVDRGPPVINSASDTHRNDTPVQLQEVVVSAQKRLERLKDVPVPVTAVSAEGLATQSQVLLRDYFSSVPGLNVAPTVQANQTVSIRGITTGTGNPTISILIDDIPYGASTNVGGGRFIPEIDPGDLARIEVLRGPQGTLYGASSLGGLVKFVTRDPSLDRLSGSVQAGLTSVADGHDPGFSARGSINIPLSDAFAMRASGFKRRDPGYVDNVRTGASDVNRTDGDGGRLALLWQPSESFSMKLNALMQELKEDGQPTVGVGLSDLQQNWFPGTGWSDRKTQSYTATLTAHAGRAVITSLTGYTINKFSGSTDLGVEVLGGFDGNKLTQELRVQMPLGSRLDWLLGAFYTDEDSELAGTNVGVDPVTGARTGVLTSAVSPTRFKEYAGFTDLTVHVTDRFDMQFGLREARIRQTFTEIDTTPAGVTLLPELHPRASTFTYLVTPRFRLSEDVMLYGRVASGYRPGGANLLAGSVPTYDPDKTANYEAGIKGDFVGGKVSVDASIYYIDWTDIQFNLLTATTPPISYTTNGSRARSRGVELATELRPLQGLDVDAWVAWDDAVLTADFPPLSSALGRSGDRLPFSSRFSAHLSAEQEFPISADLYGFVGATADHVGERVGPFRAVALRQVFPSYTQLDLRTGVRTEEWSGSFYVTNVTDKRGVLSGGLGGLPASALIYTRPRTIGLSVTRTF